MTTRRPGLEDSQEEMTFLEVSSANSTQWTLPGIAPKLTQYLDSRDATL